MNISEKTGINLDDIFEVYNIISEKYIIKNCKIEKLLTNVIFAFINKKYKE